LIATLQGNLVGTSSTHSWSESSALQHQIEHTDREIDQLVYELYGLTDKEIALVEEVTASHASRRDGERVGGG
jgi:hypothetical protein